MKILLITDNFYPNLGGIAHTLTTLCKEIRKTPHTLVIINPHFKGTNIYNILKKQEHELTKIFQILRNKENIQLFLISIIKILKDKKIKLAHRINLILYLFTKPKLLLKILNNLNTIFNFSRRLEIDLIFTAHSGDILPLSFMLSRLLRKKIIAMAHGLDFLITRYFSLKTFYFKNVDKIIVSSNWIKKLLLKIQKLDEPKIEIIHRGISLSDLKIEKSKNQLRKEFNISEKTFVILSVGRHISRKNFDLIIKAIFELKKKDPHINIKYCLIGVGPETSKLKNLTDQLDLRNNVEFLGPSEMETRNKYYKLSDVFIMPAITEKKNIEGFGIVFIEANYFKVPVIGSYSGGIAEAIINRRTGFLIKPNDLNDLIDKISFLYNNEKERKILGENGYNRVLKDFNWANIINDYINVFKNVLNS